MSHQTQLLHLFTSGWKYFLYRRRCTNNYEYFSEMSYCIVSKMFHIGTKSYVASVTSTTRTNTNPSMTCKICKPRHSTLGTFWKAKNIRRQEKLSVSCDHTIMYMFLLHTHQLEDFTFSFCSCWISLRVWIIFSTSLLSSNIVHISLNSPLTGVLHGDTHFSQDIWQAA